MRADRSNDAGLADAPAAWLASLFHARRCAHRGCIAAALSGRLVERPDGSQDNLTHGGILSGILALPSWALALWLLLSGLQGARQ